MPRGFSWRGRRAAVAGVLVVSVLAGGAGVAAAGGGAGPDPNADAVKAAAAGGATSVRLPPPPDGGVPAGVLTASRQGLDQLVSEGVIDASQADAVQSRVASGSVDPQEVVSSGVLSEAQMQRVNDMLVHVKLSFHP